ncbi:hypothetical protein LTR37_003270 [Vermiconidia calcicola]|uniref:Uncharacterized protein n=1 Tax=Vermiconidia calcicola TaxID=1690605 RepID=A0ACC3NR39_9PEZI|nr:hypothetical protein LTR37_003270 [Vermiconidia calcicola]
MGNINTRIDGATDDLANRVQSLPQELFDTIYDQVFTSAGGERINIDSSKTYKPPYVLAVDRKSRELFAKSYYSRNIFVIDFEVRSYHYTLLEEICIATWVPECRVLEHPIPKLVAGNEVTRAQWSGEARSLLAFVLHNFGIPTKERTVHVEVHFEGDDKVIPL